MGSENTSNQKKKPKNGSKGDLAAKLASLPYSFSQTLPSVTKKNNNSYFDRNFPQLQSYASSTTKTNQATSEQQQQQQSSVKHSSVVKETQERGQSVVGPTVAEIVAGVAHSSKTDSPTETENKEELEKYAVEQVEKNLYSRLVPAMNTSKTTPRRVGTSVASYSSTNNPNSRRKQTTPSSHIMKKDTLESLVEKNSERGSGATVRHSLQQEPSVDKKQTSIFQSDNEFRKKSWNVLKSNKMNRSRSANAVYEESKSLQENETDYTVDNKTTSSFQTRDNDHSNSNDGENKMDNHLVDSNETHHTGDKQIFHSDDYDKFESLLRSMGWNPENGEHGEEITEEEKAQWLQMHSGISTSSVISGNSARYSNKLTCFSTSVAVNALQAAHLRRDDESLTDSEEEASSSEYEY